MQIYRVYSFKINVATKIMCSFPPTEEQIPAAKVNPGFWLPAYSSHQQRFLATSVVNRRKGICASAVNQAKGDSVGLSTGDGTALRVQDFISFKNVSALSIEILKPCSQNHVKGQ